MAKKGMARPEWTHTKPRNEVPPVPQIQGKAKHGKENAKPIIEGYLPVLIKRFSTRTNKLFINMFMRSISNKSTFSCSLFLLGLIVFF